MPTYYDEPARLLLRRMIKGMGLKPGDEFTTAEAVAWFKARYPKFKPTNTGPQLIQASTNVPARLHHSPSSTDDLLFRVGRGRFRLYVPGKDPAPHRGSRRVS